MTQLVTALELATYFNGTTDEDDLTPEWIAQANALLVAISDDVELAAGVPILAAAEPVELLLPGTWSRDLRLPGVIRSVESVTVNGLALSASSYTWNDRTLIRRGAGLDVEDLEDFPIEHVPGARYRDGETWGGPASTVAIVAGLGFEEAPGFVKSLVLRIAARTFGNVQQVTQETLAVYSVSYGASSNVNDGSHVTKAERKRLRQALNSRAGTIDVGGR